MLLLHSLLTSKAQLMNRLALLLEGAQWCSSKEATLLALPDDLKNQGQSILSSEACTSSTNLDPC